MKNKIIPILCAATALLCVGCNNGGSSSMTSVSSMTSEVPGKEVGVLKTFIKDMNLKGYLGNNLKNNIKYWQATAYDANPNIITQIKLASHSQGSGTNFASVLGTDYFGVDQYYDIDIVTKDDVNNIGWKLKYLPASFGDRDIRFSNDPAAECNWTGAKELWIRLDASEVNDATALRVAFEDDSAGRESFSLAKGKTIVLYETNGTKIEKTVLDSGYVEIPANFEGYITLPLNDDYYKSYWCEGGDGKVTLTNIAQFQIALRGVTQMIGKSIYMRDFAIVGNVSGKELPVSNASSDTYKIVWSMDNLKKKDKSQEGSSLAWYGEFVGKLLTGISYSYRAEPDSLLVDAANKIIADLKEAQGEDGYLGVFKGAARYSIGSSNWDLWNQYHCIVGLLEWYKNTLNQDALDIAVKALDCIYETFKNRSYLVKGGFETNRGIAHAYAMMYQVTHDDKYLDEAVRIIETDCQDYNGWYKCALRGQSFYRSSSARWEVLHMIMTLGILYEETEDEEYFNVLDFIWNDILETDIHNDGGFTTNEGAVGNPYLEGVIETCCTIAWTAFSNEFYKINPEVKIIDELERSYFNGVLGALTDDDRSCTYNTPVNGIQGSCGGYDGRRVKSQQDISFQFNSGSPDMNCCQANIARGLGQIEEWACMSDGDALYLNYYGLSEIETQVDGKSVKIKQNTTYPLGGKTTIIINGLEGDAQFKLKLRIPGWSQNPSVKYDGTTVVPSPNEYYVINKVWKNGDTVELDVGVGFSCWKGQSNQKEYTSLYYGPVLLALDQYTLHEFNPSLAYNRDFTLDPKDFRNATVTSGAAYGAWMFVDVESSVGTIRLVDFSSAGKYNGSANPSSYYSWLKVNNAPSSIEVEERWKVPLFD